MIDYRYFNRHLPTIPMGPYEEGKFHCRGAGCGLGEDCPFPDDCLPPDFMIEPIEDEV